MSTNSSGANRLLSSADQFLDSIPPRGIVALAVCVIGFLFVVDLKTGYEISFSVFYLIPIGASAWYASARAGLFASLLSAFCWYWADIGAGHVYSNELFPYWNTAVRLAFFLLTSYLLVAFKEALRRERALSRRDHLTGLMNRQAFEERLRHDFDLVARYGGDIALAYIDLDRFKEVNDRFGHAEGDQVLCMIANVLQQHTRKADSAARLGGDEFALILHAADHASVEAVAAKIRAEIKIAMMAAGHSVTASIGVITCNDAAAAADMAAAINAADSLMYEAKGSRDAVVIRAWDAAAVAMSTQRAEREVALQS